MEFFLICEMHSFLFCSVIRPIRLRREKRWFDEILNYRYIVFMIITLQVIVLFEECWERMREGEHDSTKNRQMRKRSVNQTQNLFSRNIYF